MTPLEYFRQFASEFNNLNNDAVNGWIATAGVFIDVSMYATNKANLATALYAAHLAWCNKYPMNGGGSRGNVIREKDDKLERAYRPLQGSDTTLGQSPYGQQYEQLKYGSFPKAAILTRFGTFN